MSDCVSKNKDLLFPYLRYAQFAFIPLLVCRCHTPGGYLYKPNTLALLDAALLVQTSSSDLTDFWLVPNLADRGIPHSHQTLDKPPASATARSGMFFGGNSYMADVRLSRGRSAERMPSFSCMSYTDDDEDDGSRGISANRISSFS